jgi:PIN domain nuclease of toxin-antitoxin system
MRILLDTCSFLWIITDAPELTPSARELFRDPANDVFLSVVSTWEIALKNALGRLPLPESPERYVPNQREQHGIESLPLEENATLHLTKLPDMHKDPFDRMLICQAIIHGMVLMTPDELILQYPVRSTW